MITDEQWKVAYDLWQSGKTYKELFDQFDFLRMRYRSPVTVAKGIQSFACRHGLNMKSPIGSGRKKGKSLKENIDVCEKMSYVQALREQQVLLKKYMDAFPDGTADWGHRLGLHKTMRLDMEEAKRKAEKILNEIC